MERHVVVNDEIDQEIENILVKAVDVENIWDRMDIQHFALKIYRYYHGELPMLKRRGS